MSRVSIATGGAQASGFGPAISADGRYVAFMSGASNLVAGDTNQRDDVFVRDRTTGTTTRVSVATNGAEGNNNCSPFPAISDDGRYVVFESSADNLVPGDTNRYWDVFVRDRIAGTTTRVSVATDGTQANQASYGADISGNGRYVAFYSQASNLVTGDTNSDDVFVHDRITGTTSRVSVMTGGAEVRGDEWQISPRFPRASISFDGRYVAFSSLAHLAAGDGSFRDVFLHDRTTGTTTLVSEDALNDGDSVQPSISGDGRYVAFSHGGVVFVRDCSTGIITHLRSHSGRACGGQSPSITADGRFVAFQSGSNILVENDNNYSTDVFVSDRDTGTIRRISLANDGTQGDDASGSPSISGDGQYVAFESGASNLIAGDTNASWDVFVREAGDLRPSPPTSTTVEPLSPGPETLTATAVGSTDADGDTITYKYQWSKKNPDGTWGAWGNTAQSLPGTNLKIGDTWRVRAEAYDGALYSAWKIGPSVKIGPMATYTPAAGTRNVARSSSVYIDFRWIPVQSTVPSRVVLKQGTTVVAVTKSWVNNKKLRLKPKYYLKPNAFYRVYISPGIECGSGRELNWAESQAYFVTAPLVTPAGITLAAAPTAAGAQVTVDLTSAATVRTVICNIAGRVVAELPERDLPAGVSSLVWNGKGNSGTKVPAGSYLVRVEAKGAEGEQTTALAPLQIR